MQNILLYNKVSLIFLVGAMVYGALTETRDTAAVTLLVSLSVVCLVKAFQNKCGVRHTYLCGIVLALAAIFQPYVLSLLLLFILFLLKPLEALSWRNVMAMFLGVLTPVWIYLPFGLAVRMRSMDWDTVDMQWPDIPVPFLGYQDVNALHVITYGLLLMLLIVLTTRRLSYRFKGKLFVRSQRSIYISMTWIVALIAVILPSLAGFLLPLMVAFTGPVAAQWSGGK